LIVEEREMDLFTKSGYPLLTIASLYQKAIRRGDAKMAGFAACEMWDRYPNYLWKRTLVISAEDCDGLVTTEIEALYRSDKVVNAGKKHWEKRTRVFLGKAVTILLKVGKCRDADHFTNFLMTDPKLTAANVKEIELEDKMPKTIPAYVFDVHTAEGKRAGKTKKDFFKEEFEALKNRQPGLFDDMVEEVCR
jgi:hypothetical protein